MANRFYRSPQDEYVSQYIPENLGLINQALQQRQAGADKSQALLDTYEDALLKRKALAGTDTKVLKEKSQAFQDYIGSLSGKDVGNAQVSRDIAKQVRSIQSDEELAKIESNYQWNVEAQKAMKELESKGQLTPENIREYKQSLAEYTKEDGEGFRGPDLASNVFAPNMPARPKLEEMVNNLKAHGYGYNEVQGKWIHRKTGSYVKPEELNKIFSDNYLAFMNTQEGRQMAKRAAMHGISPEQQYKIETKPVVDEYTQDNYSNVLSVNDAFYKDKEIESYANLQKGWTKGLFTKDINSMNDLNLKIKELKNSNSKADHFMAAKLERQKSLLDNQYLSTLTGTERNIMALTAKEQFDKLKGANPATVAKYVEELYKFGNAPIIPGSQEPIGPGVLADAIMKGTVDQLGLIQMAGGSSAFDNMVKSLSADRVGLDYDKLSDAKDQYISKGQIFEADDIILSATAGSTKVRDAVANQMKNSVSSANWNIVSTDLDTSDETNLFTTNKKFDLNKAIQAMDNQSLKITRGSNGPEISFTLTDGDGNISYMILQSQDAGTGQISEATQDLYSTLSGGDKQLYTELKESHQLSNIQPINKNSDYNMKSDLQQSLGWDADKLNKYNDVKIVSFAQSPEKVKQLREDYEKAKDTYRANATVENAEKLEDIEYQINMDVALYADGKVIYTGNEVADIIDLIKANK